jgi:hypothetical protein
MNARCMGVISLSSDLLAREIPIMESLRLSSCDDAVGPWIHRSLWAGDHPKAEPIKDEVREQFPYLDQVTSDNFRTEQILSVRIFCASRGGYIRPHRDWTGSERAFTRLHIPLQTNGEALNSEDDSVYHMGVGEVWYLDGSRPHCGGCFHESPRIHLILDFAPDIPLTELFRDSACISAAPQPKTVNRDPLTSRQLEAIHGLAGIVTEKNLSPTLNLLSLVHFDRQVTSASAYDWLITIAGQSPDPALLSRAKQLKSAYLGPGWS